MPTILIVDDEPRILQVARDYLARAGFTVQTAGAGGAALALLRAAPPDLLILDLGLPDLDGLDVTRAVRQAADSQLHHLPIIMLTARSAETDRLVGLELGADDYLVKPFSPRELVARVRAVLRRTAQAAEGEAGGTIRAADLTLEVARWRVTRGQQLVEVTPTEFQLLALLARQPGRIFTRAQLLQAVRGVTLESYERAIDAHIKNLRRKLELDPRAPRYILTVYGVGYKFADPEE